MSLKNKVHLACLDQVAKKIADLREALNDLTAGAENDTKSSAGDKHETARAMMQLEHEKISRQLGEAILQETILDQVNPNEKHTSVSTGTLLKTNKVYIYISIALGKINVAGSDVIVLSIHSPLGQKLAGLKVGESAEVNGVKYLVEAME